MSWCLMMGVLWGCQGTDLCLFVPWYADNDGDAYGDPDNVQWDCSRPGGFVANSDDCDDTHFLVNPDGIETDCEDPVDYNCEGVRTFDDEDGDGFDYCQDCRDADPEIFPGADEYCNGIDDDCDGESDFDADEDGADAEAYGGEDCNDENAAIGPDATEHCNSSMNRPAASSTTCA